MAKRWQDWTNFVLGLWLFVSPWVLGYAGTPAAWNAYVVGAAIVVLAAVAAAVPKAWEEIVSMLLGVWLVVSPLALGFTTSTVVAAHTGVVGLLVALFAVWAMFRDRASWKDMHGSHSVEH